MRTLIIGGDGYLGWPTAMYLADRGHDVVVVDNFHRRLWDQEIGADSLIPIASLQQRIHAWVELAKKPIEAEIGDV
jgi:UDP-sulfoquinovose synthase